MEEIKEIRCYIYSTKSGNKIKVFNLIDQSIAQKEYRDMLDNNEEVGYYEGGIYPLDLNNFKFNPIKKTFEQKTQKEMIDSGILKLKKHEKIILNNIVFKEPWEMYEEGIILTKTHEIVYKIDKTNSIKRKNIIELLKTTNTLEKEIKDGILEKIIFSFDYKYNQMKKKYPDFEVYNFSYKTAQANLWNGLDTPAKMRILRSESRLSSFNVLISEFYHKLTEDEQNNLELILNKMNDLVSIIIEKEKIYKDNYSYLIEMRNYFTSKLRDMFLTENSVNGFINEFNGFYGEDKLKSEDIYLSERYYASIPMPETNFYA